MGDAHRSLLRQDTDESLDGNARDGNQDDERGKTEDDEVLWTDGGTESGRSAEIRTIVLEPEPLKEMIKDEVEKMFNQYK